MGDILYEPFQMWVWVLIALTDIHLGLGQHVWSHFPNCPRIFLQCSAEEKSWLNLSFGYLQVIDIDTDTDTDIDKICVVFDIVPATKICFCLEALQTVFLILANENIVGYILM